MNLCPNCGHNLRSPLLDGIAACQHCSRVFDSSAFNRLLSAAWTTRKKNYDDINCFLREGFNEHEALLVIYFVAEENYSHEELVRALENLGVSKVYEPRVDA